MQRTHFNILTTMTLTTLLLWASLGPARALANEAVIVHFHLSPAGSFLGKTSDLKGYVTPEAGGGYQAKDISVNLKSLKTGIELRDRHTQKHLETDKFPYAELIAGVGRSGHGTGKIRIHGHEKPISGSYEVKDGKSLLAKFSLHLADFGITGVKYMSVGLKDDVEVEVLIPIKAASTAAPLSH